MWDPETKQWVEPPTQEELIARANRPIYNSFDEYVAAHPEGETFRRWITNDGRRNVILLPTTPNTNGIPGDYLWACIIQYPSGTYKVGVYDCDDGEVEKEVDTLEEAQEWFEKLKLLAPFGLYEMRQFGYDSWSN